MPILPSNDGPISKHPGSDGRQRDRKVSNGVRVAPISANRSSRIPQVSGLDGVFGTHTPCSAGTLLSSVVWLSDLPSSYRSGPTGRAELAA